MQCSVCQSVGKGKESCASFFSFRFTFVALIAGKELWIVDEEEGSNRINNARLRQDSTFVGKTQKRKRTVRQYIISPRF